ncbi:unnamed protein product [Prunus armeniaca]
MASCLHLPFSCFATRTTLATHYELEISSMKPAAKSLLILASMIAIRSEAKFRLLMLHWHVGRVDTEPMEDDVWVNAKDVRWRPCEHIFVVLEEGGQLHLLVWA